MEISRLFFLLIFVQQVLNKSFKASGRKSVLSLAISKILHNYHGKNSHTVDLIYYGEKFGESEKLCSEILRRKPDSVIITVKRGGKDNPWANQLNVSSILLFDSPSNFKRQNISWLSNKHKRYQHLVVAPRINGDDIKGIYDGFSIDNVIFLATQPDKSIAIISVFMYTPVACRTIQFLKINSFSRKTLQWRHHFFFLNKYENIYGCSVRMLVDDRTNVKNTVGVNIIHAYASLIKSNVTILTTGHLKRGITTSDIDLYSRQSAYSLAFKNNMTSSYPYFIDHWVFFIPSGELYTSLEKALMPFQPEVWIAIVTTFAVFVVGIQIVKLTSAYLQDLVFGFNIRTPTINFVSTFLTGVQLKVPTRNFSRFLLMNCIFLCLIIRTCYQSELYKYLQKDIRKPEVQTILEMIENNFTFLDDGYLMKYINETADAHGLQRPRWEFCDFSKVSECYNLVVEPSAKYTVIGTEKLHWVINNVRLKTGQSSIFILKESLRNSFVGLAFKDFSPFYETLDEKIGKMSSAGLINLWLTREFKNNDKKHVLTDIGPQVLTMEHLEIGFKFCLVPLSLSVIVFIVELNMKHLKKLFKKIIK